jgi:hypothetical protein
VADALSRALLHVAAQRAPRLHVFSFQPPLPPPGHSFSPPQRRGMPSDVKALPFVPATPLGAMDGRAFS